MLLLAALVLVPVLFGRHVDNLRQERVDHVFPAHQTLQESRSLLTEQLAAIRGYQISGRPEYLAQYSDALIRERPVTAHLATLASALDSAAIAAVRSFAARTEEWQEAPRAMLAGAITREQLAASLPLGQQRFEAALAAAEDVREALNGYERQLGERIESAARVERVLSVLLAFAALATGAVMIWLTTRLEHATRELEARAEKLRVSEERFRLIAENLREMIWISDPAYTVQYYLSPAYERIWGRPVDEARRDPRSFLHAVLPEDRPRVEAALEGYADGDYAAEYRILRRDGETRWIAARAYPVRDEAGDLFLIAGIAEDITDQKEVELQRERLLEREQEAHRRTEAALQLRDRVVRIVSHDLKNPLHTIGMAAELLEMPLPEHQHEKQIGIIRRTVARANRMVTDLLDAARLESGRAIAISRTLVPVQSILAEAIEAFRFQAEQKNQQLTCDDLDPEAQLLGDHDRLVQALSNLIGNAVKFTPEGGHIRVKSETATDGSTRFSVADTGPGIAPDMLEHLFEPFTQARDTASLGTGLGLSIAQGIVHAHGGRIDVRSELGTGTTFTFVLPGPAPARDYPDPVDETLDETFPASDPPAWWGGRDSA